MRIQFNENVRLLIFSPSIDAIYQKGKINLGTESLHKCLFSFTLAKQKLIYPFLDIFNSSRYKAILKLEYTEFQKMALKLESCLKAFWLILNVAAVVGIVSMNKLVFTRYKFNFGTLLTVIHFTTTSVFLEIGKLFGLIERKKDVRLLKIVPLSISFCGFVVLTNLSLQYNTIGTYQVKIIAILNAHIELFRWLKS